MKGVRSPWFLVPLLLGAALPAVAAAQTSVTPAQEAEAAFSAAQEAVAAGDVRGAIAALERVLQIDPGLANIKLELGLLYLRVGQQDLARSYLEQALNAADAPEEARQRARAALRTADSLSRRWSLSGTLFAGAQYQTNPNGSPDTVSIVGPFGTPLLLSGDQLQIPHGDDVSASLSGTAEIAYTLGGQRGHQIVAEIAAARNEYDQTDELDATYLHARLGPRFNLGPALSPTGYIRPFLSTTSVALDEDIYFQAYGGGLAVLAQPGLALALSGEVAYENRDYDPSDTRPLAPEQSGDYWLATAEAAWQMSPRLRISAGLVGESVSARADYWSRVSYGPELRLTTAIAPPLGRSAWVLALGGGYRRSDYDEPDPQIDPSHARAEDRFDVEAALNIPLARSLSLDLRGQQTWNRANLPNYRFKNSFASLGVTWRF